MLGIADTWLGKVWHEGKECLKSLTEVMREQIKYLKVVNQSF
jgi:hypothetical protein